MNASCADDGCAGSLETAAFKIAPGKVDRTAITDRIEGEGLMLADCETDPVSAIVVPSSTYEASIVTVYL
jgi:hypothetical protein